MSLAKELLEQAVMPPVAGDSSLPVQALIRRSISSSYYAVFHLLIDAASREFVPGAGRDGLRAAVSRAFAHLRMADACRAFCRDGHKLTCHLSGAVPIELKHVASGFIDLQEQRHRADYDTSIQFEALDAIRANWLARQIFGHWSKIQHSEDARVFLVALLLWKDLRD